MQIRVTQEHIDRGLRCSPGRCPVALALRSTLNKSVNVGKREAFIGDAIVKLPDAAKIFIHNFDERLPVKPFEFDLW
jgi:hypothetical protein